MADNFVYVFVFVLGAVVGSFLNVVILRLPFEGESIIFPASRCPNCGKKLKWYDNIPIISFILLMARCRYCKKPISRQYPIVELAMGLLSLALFHRFFISVSFLGYFFFCAALLVIIFIDAYHQIIPDVISIPGIVLGFGFSFFTDFVTWKDSGIGLIAGAGTLYAVAAGYYLLTKREGMGGGDIKLLGMLGAFLGWQSLPFVIFSSSLTGAVAGVGAMVKQGKGGKSVIPFGPFLALAGMAYLFFRERIWYFLFIISAPS
ncbi:MAG: prepilin peptidase [Desulfobulbaceae bacterium]|nr:prepilin peptidase [Desulfobulbaceae bacterium]